MTSNRSTRTFKASERGATLVEYALVVALVAVVCIVAVVFLGEAAEEKHEDASSKDAVVQVNYEGNVLSCVNFLEIEDAGGDSFSCNFEGYYANPRKVSPGMNLPRAEVINIEYNGRDLFCVHIDDDDIAKRKASCDFVRYYKDLES